MSRRLFILVSLFVFLLPPIQPTFVIAVVGNGTPGSCTEVVFDRSLATVQANGSGKIIFNCGGAATIFLTDRKSISKDVTIQGDSLITLAGGPYGLYGDQYAFGLFYVTAEGKLSIQSITLGYAEGRAISNEGELLLTDSIIRNSGPYYSPHASGGAIWNSGSLILTGGLITDNFGWGNFYGSDYDEGGAGIYNVGSATLTGVTIKNNLGSMGGGIHNNGVMMLDNTTISGNDAGYGGGIYNDGSISIANTTLSSNTGYGWGGGIYNTGSISLVNTTFSFNSASIIDINDTYKYGDGGLVNDNGTASFVNVTLSGNSVGQTGGGIYNMNGSVTLTNVTLNGNTAAEGGGIYAMPGTSTSLKNVILAQGAGGANCSGPITSAGYNLSSDGSCPFSEAGDQNNTDPLLGPLFNNGGPTLTHMLHLGSPAIDAGTSAGAPSTDQRGRPRPGDQPGDTLYDIGAVERQSDDATSWIYLPLVIR